MSTWFKRAASRGLEKGRARLNGVLIDEWDVTTSCRQCRVGAECAEACPEDALKWDASGALKVTGACTGLTSASITSLIPAIMGA